MGEYGRVVKSTADLSPEGLLGYAKGIAVTVTAVLVAIVDYLPEGAYKQWTQLAILVLGAITTIAVPNRVHPVLLQSQSPPPMPPGPAGPVVPGL